MINIDGSYYLDCDGDYVKVNVEYLTSSLMLRPNQDFARMTNAHFSAFAREFFSVLFLGYKLLGNRHLFVRTNTDHRQTQQRQYTADRFD